MLISTSLVLGAPYQTTASIAHAGERYFVSASFEVPASLCQSYAYITDYEGAKNLPGVLESQILSSKDNVTTVERVVNERFFLAPIEMRSLIQYTERPTKYTVDFEQIHGDTRFYKGTWQLSSKGDSTVFYYTSEVEPGSIFPTWVVEYFMHEKILERFQSMAERASHYTAKPIANCH